MKILHVNASYKPAYVYGGPTISVAKLCEEVGFDSAQPDEGFAQSGFDSAQPDNDSLPTRQAGAQPDSDYRQKIEVSVYTTLANGREELPYTNGELLNVNGVNVRYFKRITKDHSHFSPSFLIHFWKNVNVFDIIHIHAWWNLVSVGAAFICVLKGRPYILSPRGTLSTYSFYNRKAIVKRFFHSLVGKPLLKRATFQVSSAKEKRDIEQIFDASAKAYIIPNFVELKRAWEKDFAVNLNHQKAEILFFSRIEEKKGLEFLLEACALLTIPYHLTIAGSGEEVYVRTLKILSEKLGIAQHVTWLGLVASEHKFEVLAQYDLLVLPSYDENFANVVIESLACGTPVLLSPKVGLADYVTEKKLGWVVDQDSKLIASHLEMIFEKTKAESISLRKAARLTIKEDFSEKALTKAYIHFYQSIMK